MSIRIIAILILIIIVSSIPHVLAQQMDPKIPAEHISLEIFIEKDAKVHVIHTLQNSKDTTAINTISGNVSNLTVRNIDGEETQHSIIGDNKGVVISPSSEKILIEYNLEDVLLLTEGVWTWNYLYLESSAFYFPEVVDLVFVNDRPVPMGDAKGVNCHGCQMILEYVIDEPIKSKGAKWEETEYRVDFRTLSEINSFNFNQSTKTISFDVNEGNRFVTILIPSELLGKPYEVFLEDKKILKHEFLNNQTHEWLNVRPQTPGNVQIIGTTVVPEFPFLIPLMIGLSMVILLQYKNKFSLH